MTILFLVFANLDQQPTKIMIGIIDLIVDYCLVSSQLHHVWYVSALSYPFIWRQAGFLDMVYEAPPRSLMLMRIHHDVSYCRDMLSEHGYVKVHNCRF